MNKLSRRLSIWQDYLVLSAALTISFYLIFFANAPRQLGGVHALTLEIIGRLTAPVHQLERWTALRESNRLLRFQNTVLQLKNAQLAEAYHENQRLRQMVGFGLLADYPMIPARVTGSSGRAGLQNFIVDAGADRGVRVNMTVVSADGLVGRIVQVSPGFASGQALSDPNFRAAALIQRSRVQGVFQWAGYESGLLNGVYLSADVRVGDVVVTSGLNSMFVPGLKIGTVTRIDEAGGGLFKKIFVRPKTDFSRLEEVFIVQHATGGTTP